MSYAKGIFTIVLISAILFFIGHALNEREITPFLYRALAKDLLQHPQANSKAASLFQDNRISYNEYEELTDMFKEESDQDGKAALRRTLSKSTRTDPESTAPPSAPAQPGTL